MQKPNPVSLKKQAVGSTVWTILGYGAQQGQRFAGNLVLTRLLAPEAFGLMALVRTVVTGLQLFSDVGLRPNVIRSPRGEDPVFLNTAWTIQVLRGFAIGFFCLLVAIPVARYYEESMLRSLVPLLGLATVITGFSSTSLLVLSRRMEVRTSAIVAFCTNTVGLVVIITWALFVSPSVWALIAGTFASQIFLTLWSHRLTADLPPNRFAWDRSVAHEILSFGRWIFLSTIATFLADQCDRLILGKLLTFEQLGIYSLALFMSDVPIQLLKRWSTSVLMPVLSKKIDLPRPQLRQKLQRGRAVVLLGLAGVLAPLVAFADVAIDFLYNERYVQAGWMLSILALGIWPRVLSQTARPTLLVLGKPLYAAFGNVTKLVYLLIALPLGYRAYGMLGVIVVMALNDISFYLALQIGLAREKMLLLQQDLLSTLFMAGLTSLLVVGRLQLGWGWPLEGLMLPG